jgi:thioredoxin 1
MFEYKYPFIEETMFLDFKLFTGFFWSSQNIVKAKLRYQNKLFMDEIEKIRQKKLHELMKKMREGEAHGNSEMIDTHTDKPITVSSQNFNEILRKHRNVVVDFWAEWCMPCRMIAPIVEELAKEYAGKIVFAKLNTDENQQIAARYGISAIPTLIFFKNGRPVDQIVGALPKSEMKKWIERNLD